jgi:hypothetical protein
MQRILATAVLAIIMLGASSCNVDLRTEGTSTPTPPPAPTSLPVATYSQSQTATQQDIDTLKRAVTNMKAARSFHLESSVNLTDVIIRDVDLANKRSRYTRCNVNDCSLVITIVTETFTTKDGGQSYVRGDKGNLGLDSLNYVWDNLTPKKLDVAAPYIQVGNPPNQTFGGVGAIHLTIRGDALSKLDTTLEIVGTDGTFDVWFTTGDNPVVRQVMFTGKAGFWPFAGQDLIAVARWSKINEPVSIEPPPADTITP